MVLHYLTEKKGIGCIK